MKDKKKLVAIVIVVIAAVLLVILGLIALDEKNAQNKVESGATDNTAQEEAKGKCAIDECMKLLEPKMNLAKANEIMGFEGEKDGENEKYTWQLTSKSKIVIEYKDNLGTITATYNKDDIKDSEFKLAKGYELQNLLREGTSYTYKETVEQFGGVEGHLATHSPTSKRYIWVNNDGITFGATFSDSINGKTSIISIR